MAFKAQQPWHVCFNKPLHPRQASARHAAHEVLSSAQLAGPPSLGRKAPCCLDPQVAPARPGRRQELGPVEVWKRAGRHALNPFTIQKDISMAPAASSTLTPCSCSIPPSLHSVRARALPPRAFRGRSPARASMSRGLAAPSPGRASVFPPRPSTRHGDRALASRRCPGSGLGRQGEDFGQLGWEEFGVLASTRQCFWGF